MDFSIINGVSGIHFSYDLFLCVCVEGGLCGCLWFMCVAGPHLCVHVVEARAPLKLLSLVFFNKVSH